MNYPTNLSNPMVEPRASPAAPVAAPAHLERHGPRDRWWRAALTLLPLIVAVAFYYPPGRDAGMNGVYGDAHFYVYQLTRMAELNGAWWKLGTDPLAGHPYPTGVGRNPGLYEGVDFLLVSTLTARFLDPVVNYNVMILLMLAVNGWVAAWLAYRLTRSYLATALAVVLITLNFSTLGRINGHLNLFKYGWVLLAVWAFSRYLDAPSVKRGAVLGAAAALYMQGSFYFGFLLGVVLAAYWLVCLAARRVTRKHLAATGVAVAVFALLGAALTYPVWAVAPNAPLTDTYFQRARQDTWHFSSELWQYFVAPGSGLANKCLQGSGRVVPEGNDLLKSPDEAERLYAKTVLTYGNAWEGWHYPGLAVLSAVGLYVVLRLRGWQLCAHDPRLLDRMMLLIGLFVVLSLSGGPAALLYEWMPSFRCYGRAGLLAVGLWSVAAAVVYHGVIRGSKSLPVRLGLAAVALGLVCYDGYYLSDYRYRRSRVEHPAWVGWLAEQQPGVRLAAIDSGCGTSDFWPVRWHYAAPQQRFVHHHAVLNGCDIDLLHQDLLRLGTYMADLSDDGLRYLVSLGYETLAFEQRYLEEHPRITTIPWLERIQVLDGWHIYRATAQAPLFRTSPVAVLLRPLSAMQTPKLVAPHTRLAEALPIDEIVVVPFAEPTSLAWADAEGRLVSKPQRVLTEHVYLPGQPAYALRTPAQPGRYDLVFLDRKKRRIAAKPFEVVAEHAPR